LISHRCIYQTEIHHPSFEGYHQEQVTNANTFKITAREVFLNLESGCNANHLISEKTCATRFDGIFPNTLEL
jgi:hypothetical protein